MFNRGILFALIFSGGRLLGADTYTASILYPIVAPGGTSIQLRQVTADGSIGFGPSGPESHALLWSPPDGAVTDLNPTGFGAVTSSQALGAYGDQQVGSYIATQGGPAQAVLWSGTASSAVDLDPTQLGALSSEAEATDGAQQVGEGRFGTTTSSTEHALVWSGTAASAVDLNPTALGNGDAVGSVALGVSNGAQVGDYSTSQQPMHAVLWNGTADSAVDLHPLDPTLEFSEAVDIRGNQQVGSARANGGSDQAFLWFGTAASAVNLNPTSLTGINASLAVATNGQEQVGSGFDGSATTDDDDEALVWSGTADSVVDLQMFLPSSGIWNFSDADSVDSAGNVFGTANGTFDDATGYFAVEWSPVPEPSSPVLFTLMGAISLVGSRLHGRRK